MNAEGRSLITAAINGVRPFNREKYRETGTYPPEKSTRAGTNAAAINISCVFGRPKLTGNALRITGKRGQITGKNGAITGKQNSSFPHSLSASLRQRGSQHQSRKLAVSEATTTILGGEMYG